MARALTKALRALGLGRYGGGCRGRFRLEAVSGRFQAERAPRRRNCRQGGGGGRVVVGVAAANAADVQFGAVMGIVQFGEALEARLKPRKPAEDGIVAAPAEAEL